MIAYDILKDSINNLLAEITDDDRVAIICIAESNINRCYENYNDAYKINVTGTKSLIHQLSMEGFRVLFFSSDQVFDGALGNYTEQSKQCPTNKYGMMKSELEDYLLENEPDVCILRLPKVLSALRKRQNLFTEWEDSIESGSIRCIKGNRMSLISMDDIYQVCHLVVEKGLKGLYNIAGDKDYSRAELANIFYSKLGVDNVEIIECDVEEFHFKEKRPLNLSMNNTKFKIETGYIFESMDSVIDKYITNLENQDRKGDKIKEKFDKTMESYFQTEKFQLGPWTSESMLHDPKHLAFVLSRYKFVAKMVEGHKNVLEIGCGDAFGAPIVGKACNRLYAIDWEEKLIKDNANRLQSADNIEFICHDINTLPLSSVKVNTIYNIDFIEHIDPAKEDIVMHNMIASYENKEEAVMIIGTPNLTASQYASPQSTALHCNLKSYDTLKGLLSKYFYNVFMFGMNDEVLHTGYAPMCHYLWGIGVGIKSRINAIT